MRDRENVQLKYAHAPLKFNHFLLPEAQTTIIVMLSRKHFEIKPKIRRCKPSFFIPTQNCLRIFRTSPMQ